MNTAKPLSVALMLVLICSAIMLIQATSASVPTPSTPELTAKFVDRSYDVPEATTQNQYTGETIITPAHRVQNYTIDLIIKNQPYTPTTSGEGNWMNYLTYYIQVKGSYAKDWIPMYSKGEGPKASDSGYTTITYVLQGPVESNYTLSGGELGGNTITQIPPKAQLDFRVQALIGHFQRTTAFASMHFVGEESDWSTQTVTIPAAEPSPTTASTTTAPIRTGNSQNDLIILVIASSATIVSAVVVVAAVLVRKARKTTS